MKFERMTKICELTRRRQVSQGNIRTLKGDRTYTLALFAEKVLNGNLDVVEGDIGGSGGGRVYIAGIDVSAFSWSLFDEETDRRS